MISRMASTPNLPPCPRCDGRLLHFLIGECRPSGALHQVECVPCQIRSGRQRTLQAALRKIKTQPLEIGGAPHVWELA